MIHIPEDLGVVCQFKIRNVNKNSFKYTSEILSKIKIKPLNNITYICDF